MEANPNIKTVDINGVEVPFDFSMSIFYQFAQKKSILNKTVPEIIGSLDAMGMEDSLSLFQIAMDKAWIGQGLVSKKPTKDDLIDKYYVIQNMLTKTVLDDIERQVPGVTAKAEKATEEKKN